MHLSPINKVFRERASPRKIRRMIVLSDLTSVVSVMALEATTGEVGIAIDKKREANKKNEVGVTASSSKSSSDNNIRSTQIPTSDCTT